MPIGTIVGIRKNNYVKKDTGELKTSTVIHYTYKSSEKGMVGIGADSVFVDVERFDPPTDIGSVYLIEKEDGFLRNLEKLGDAPKPEGK